MKILFVQPDQKHAVGYRHITFIEPLTLETIEVPQHFPVLPNTLPREEFLKSLLTYIEEFISLPKI